MGVTRYNAGMPDNDNAMPCRPDIITENLLCDGVAWRADQGLTKSQMQPQLKPWLCDQGSLTTALKNISVGTFQVQLISQKIAVPRWHEQKKLGRPLYSAAMVREVNLCIHGTPVVFARSVIPLNLSRQGGGGLARLGQTPLGHLLFKSGRVRISHREFLKLRNNFGQISARRTPYDYLGESILVTEYFLPSLNKHI